MMAELEPVPLGLRQAVECAEYTTFFRFVYELPLQRACLSIDDLIRSIDDLIRCHTRQQGPSEVHPRTIRLDDCLHNSKGHCLTPSEYV